MAEAHGELDLSVATPLGLAMTAKAEFVTAPSVAGEMTVLPGHLPLLAALKAGLLRTKAGHEETIAAIGPGFLEVGPDRVAILTDRIAKKGEVDLGDAMKDLESAQRALASYTAEHEGAAYEEHQLAVEWAQARIDLVEATK
jgi:F-type H+-transporting ATPase subunit epsilon